MSSLRVSVVITCYNYGRFLDEAIRSVLGQSQDALEVIVVDDGSQDDSVVVARRHPVVLLEQANQGVCAARNLGGRAARGEYLLFLDADDVLEPGHVAACVAALDKAPREVAYAYTGMRYFGQEEGELAGRPFARETLIERNFVHASALMRREVFLEVGGFNDAWRDGLEDYELWIRMLACGYHGQLVEGVMLGYRRHGPSRNAISDRGLKAIRWRVRFTYPKLFWRKLLKDPLRSAHWLALFLAGRLDPSNRSSQSERPVRPNFPWRKSR